MPRGESLFEKRAEHETGFGGGRKKNACTKNDGIGDCVIYKRRGIYKRDSGYFSGRSAKSRLTAVLNLDKRNTFLDKESLRRGGRAAEGPALEKQYTSNRVVGSNPTLSARIIL